MHGDDVIRFLLCACERVTSVGVVYPGMFPILVIGLRDCVGGSLGRSDWLDRLSWWAWLAGHFSSMLLCAALPYVVPLNLHRRCCQVVLSVYKACCDVNYFSGKLVSSSVMLAASDCSVGTSRAMHHCMLP